MSKRFGRNQRRKLLEELRIAQHRAHQSSLMVTTMSAQLNRATERAFQQFMANEHRVRAYVGFIADSLGKALGEELRPHAEKLAAHAMGRATIEARGAGWEREQIVIRGTIPHLSFSYAYKPSLEGTDA